MFYVWSLIVGFCAFGIGTFGFCQIIGCIRIRNYRPASLTAVTIIIWFVILLAGAVIAHTLLSDYTVSYYIGTGISLIASWNTGKNGPE